MKKRVFGRQFKRDTNERKSLFKGLISSLILRERIKTTEAKAKSIRAEIDKIITKAKKGESARNNLQKVVYGYALDKLIKDIAPRFEKRQGGYTRIVRIGKRFSDSARIVLIEWTEMPKTLTIPGKEEVTETAEKGKKKQAKKDKKEKAVKLKEAKEVKK